MEQFGGSITLIRIVLFMAMKWLIPPDSNRARAVNSRLASSGRVGIIEVVLLSCKPDPVI